MEFRDGRCHAFLWKKFVLRSPCFSQFALDRCAQIISSCFCSSSNCTSISAMELMVWVVFGSPLSFLSASLHLMMRFGSVLKVLSFQSFSASEAELIFPI